MRKRVLLTGGAGSIGVHVLIHLLHNTDWEVVIIDSFRHKGIPERVVEILRNHLSYWSRVFVLTHDLTDPLTSAIQAKIGHIDYIINLASLSDVEASIQDPVPFVQNNTTLTLNLLEYAREIKPIAFIQFSTDEVYGPSGKDQQHKEGSAHKPSNPYAASKAAQEDYATAWWRTYGVPVIITNTMNNFGEYQQSSKYPVIIQRKVAAGEKLAVHGTPEKIGTRYYIHSRNAADALLFILKNLSPYMHKAGEVDEPDHYNIVGDKQVDNLSLAKLIAKLMGKKLNYEYIDFHSTRPGHDLHYGLDGSKLKKKGWKSPLSFEESLENTIKWQTEHDDWIK